VAESDKMRGILTTILTIKKNRTRDLKNLARILEGRRKPEIGTPRWNSEGDSKGKQEG